MTTIETIFYSLNLTVVVSYLGAEDIGGTITIHMFGAYFGIVASYFFQPTKAIEDKFKQGKGDYKSYLISMAGTIFLFMYWPSFNAALRNGEAR